MQPPQGAWVSIKRTRHQYLSLVQHSAVMLACCVMLPYSLYLLPHSRIILFFFLALIPRAGSRRHPSLGKSDN